MKNYDGRQRENDRPARLDGSRSIGHEPIILPGVRFGRSDTGELCCETERKPWCTDGCWIFDFGRGWFVYRCHHPGIEASMPPLASNYRGNTLRQRIRPA